MFDKLAFFFLVVILFVISYFVGKLLF